MDAAVRPAPLLIDEAEIEAEVEGRSAQIEIEPSSAGRGCLCHPRWAPAPLWAPLWAPLLWAPAPLWAPLWALLLWAPARAANRSDTLAEVT